MTERVFVAVEPPSEAREQLWGAMASWRARWNTIRWERPDKLHVTLRFLGDRVVADIEAVRRVLAAVASAHDSFAARLGGVGCYPSMRNPRVVWVGLLLGGLQLVALQAAVEDLLDEEGLGRDSRPFSPHLTVGRIKKPLRGASLEGLSLPSIDFRVDRLILKRSALTPGGSIYTDLASYPLGGGNRKE